MVNLLLFIANTYASDVYDICLHKKELWIESKQAFITQNSYNYYGGEPLQVIIHEKYIEINRKKTKIENKFTNEGMPCWREHENSFFCYNEQDQKIYWEINKRNGSTVRDSLKVCLKNGERVD